MIRILSDQDRARLDEQIVEVEKRTKAQIVMAVIQRSDSYVELPWKAFALGVSIAGLLVFILDIFLYSWTSGVMAFVAVVITLVAGSACALLAVLVPGFARFFLSAHRADVEVRQYAETLFLDRELFATDGRTGVLMLVSLFERQVILLPDKGISNRLRNDTMNDVIAPMIPFLKRKEIYRALENGLGKLSMILGTLTLSDGSTGKAGDVMLSDEIIEEKGV
jgi:putative membrane protein